MTDEQSVPPKRVEAIDERSWGWVHVCWWVVKLLFFFGRSFLRGYADMVGEIGTVVVQGCKMGLLLDSRATVDVLDWVNWIASC